MPYNFYLILHLVGTMLLIGFTFYAFAEPNARTRKWVLGIGGLSSLAVLVSGFGMIGMEFPGWMAVKLVAWIGLSAFGGMAYRRPGLKNFLMLISIVLIVAAVWAVVEKPF